MDGAWNIFCFSYRCIMKNEDFLHKIYLIWVRMKLLSYYFLKNEMHKACCLIGEFIPSTLHNCDWLEKGSEAEG